MNYLDLKQVFCDLNRDHPTQNLTAHITFAEDSFQKPYSLLSRTYRITSGEKAFWSRTGSRSIFAYCLDITSDQGVRLDWYMAEEGNLGGWKVQDCYILERMRDVTDIPNAERVVQPDGTVCYFFGDTTIQVNEILQDGKRKLEPIAGDQAAYGEWEDLSIDQVCGYCFLLEKYIAGGEII